MSKTQIKSVEGTNTNDTNYQFASLPKSGFNLSHTSLIGGVPIGREIPSLNWVMPGDKVSGGNEHQLTAEQLVTPVVGDMRVNFHSYYVKLRSIDSDFEEMMVPTKVNAMSANYSAPTFMLNDVWELTVLAMLKSCFPVVTDGNGHVEASDTYASWGATSTAFNAYWASKMAGTFSLYLKRSYLDDSLLDLRDQLQLYVANVINAGDEFERTDAYKNIVKCITDFWCGEGSVMDYLGYTIVKHVDVDYWMNQLPEFSSVAAFVSGASGCFSTIPMTEYALRAHYFIWYIHERDNNLEPRTSDLPNPRKWSSVPLLNSTNMVAHGMQLLPLRFRCWTADAFNTAMIDDISRHVFAPVLTSSSLATQSRTEQYSSPTSPVYGTYNNSYEYFSGSLLSSEDITYTDINGSVQILRCPIPQALSKSDSRYSENTYVNNHSLDLFTLRKAKMMERTLKRIFANGGSDIYNERFKRLYDVNIPDAELSQPQYLNGSSTPVGSNQQVASTGAVPTSTDSGDMVKQGSRLVIAGSEGGEQDRYTYFCNEFGVIITHMSIIPTCQYDTTIAQHFMIKQADFPNPLFANQQEELVNTSEISRVGTPVSGFDNVPFGHVPYAHAWRYRVNEVHGQMLSSKFDYTFCRYFRGLTADGVPKLNYQFIHCRPNLPMFLNKILLDGQFYGTVKHNFLVERTLPTPIEVI